MSRYTDKLQLIFDDVYAGANRVNARLSWFSSDLITTEDVFTPPGGSEILGSWWADGGDLALAPALREPRIICRKGKASFTFHGPTLILRVFVNPGFGEATVKIDGVSPSAISGVLDPMDTVSANSEDHSPSWGNEYLDLVIADNLSDTDHTVELYCDNAEVGTTGYFPIAGYKTRAASIGREISAWILPFGTPQNRHIATITNLSGSLVKNVEVEFQSGMVDDAGDELGAVVLGDMANAATEDIPFTFAYVASETESGQESKTIQIEAEYPDAEGTIEYETETVVDSTDTTTITFSSGWTHDTSNGEARAFSGATGKTATLSFSGDSLKVRIQNDYGWGKLNTTIDGVPSTQLNCHDAVGGGFYEDTVVAVTGSGAHTLVMTSNNSLPAPFASIKYATVVKFSLIQEVATLEVEKALVPPFSPTSVAASNGDIICDDPDTEAEDFDIPKTNSGINKLNTYFRVPTFVVYYGSGKEDILEQYDIVVCDPHAVSRKLVQRLQSKGIRVLAYVSFGEEDGTIADPFDPSSSKSPWTGDGTGPGGFAGYYCKGGNRFAEMSECKNDRQCLEGVKACSKSNAKYLSSTGRCSKACGLDWREGYSDWRLGNVCGGGKTKENYWQRDASQACSNASCPSYAPMNQACAEFEATEAGWGQDFSIMTTDFPDENGIWGSYYIDATDASWKARIEDYYLQSVFGVGIAHSEESCTVSIHESDSTPVFRVANYPIDPDETIEVKTAGGFVYTPGTEYTFDAKLGTFRMTPAEGSPATPADTVLKVTYTRLGLEADGVFMDTVDTVDVYPSDEFKAAMAAMINSLKADYPTKLFCSNRGFTILDDIIASCSYVMFESFLVDYDWDTGEYSIITDEAAIAFNNGIITQLNTLRESNNFDVLALNYCENGTTGDALRQYIADTCRALGFLSWSSTILLNAPLGNSTITSPSSVPEMFRSNAWRFLRAKPVF